MAQKHVQNLIDRLTDDVISATSQAARMLNIRDAGRHEFDLHTIKLASTMLHQAVRALDLLDGVIETQECLRYVPPTEES